METTVGHPRATHPPKCPRDTRIHPNVKGIRGSSANINYIAFGECALRARSVANGNIRQPSQIFAGTFRKVLLNFIGNDRSSWASELGEDSGVISGARPDMH